MQDQNRSGRERFVRTEMLLGSAGMEQLKNARVAIFGIGGVGGYVAEALARSGVGAFELIDNDTVAISNLNRQIIALESSIGRYKTEVMKERIAQINPDASVEVRECFFLPENADLFDFSSYSYVVDAIDTVTAKIELVMRAQAAGVPIISSMGTGNKLNPAMLQVADIYKTKVCPLARVMRRELKARGVKHLKVVYSEELPLTPMQIKTELERRTSNPPFQMRRALSGENGGCSCQVGIQKLHLTSCEAACVHAGARCPGDICLAPTGAERRVARADSECPLYEETVTVDSECSLYACAGADMRMEFSGTMQEESRTRRAVPGSVSFVPPVAGMILASEVVKDLTGSAGCPAVSIAGNNK